MTRERSLALTHKRFTSHLAVDEPAATDRDHWLLLAMDGPKVLADDRLVDVARVSLGSAFLRILRELRPSLAVISCPPAGPAEILAVVAARRERPTLRLILLNDPGDIHGRLHALSLGFDEALPSSTDPAELTGRAWLLIEGRQIGRGHDGAMTVAPGVVLDLAGRRVRRGGVDIHLRPKEFALLAMLASDPGRVFSRAELVDGAWGPAYSGGQRTIDVHVRWLRAKIEPDPARPAHVITVRGAGYRLDPTND